MKNQRLAWVALAIVCIVWGTTYLALRVVVTHFPSFLFLGIRQAVAGLLLGGGLLLFGGRKWPAKGVIIRQSIGGFFMITLGNGLVGWGEKTIPSGIAALICSTMPLWVNMINLLINRNEKPNGLIYTGIICGIAGMFFIFRENLAYFGNTAYLIGIIITFTATLSWASASVWIKRVSTNTDPLMNAAIQMLSGGIWMFVFSFILEDYHHLVWSSDVIWSLIYLIFIGSILAYGAYGYALSKLPITIVSMYAYINPMVAVILGWLILKEALNIYTAIAFVLTVSGIYLVNKGYQLRHRAIVTPPLES
jgi:drug/metabolite transporter (DMT)-like permease